jgi:hypothetical protein
MYKKLYNLLFKRHLYGLTSPIRILPDFIIIGAGRCGTTSLYYDICEHPCVLKAAYDELGFFDDNYHLGLNWYRSLFPTSFKKNQIKTQTGFAITGEDTPSYIRRPWTATRILSSLPKIKLVVILRNPVDRTYSHYHLGIRSGNEKHSFEIVIKNDMEFLEDKKHEKNNKSEYFESTVEKSYLARGFYAEQLQIWMNKFPREQLLIISTEDLAEEPHDTLTNVFSFLGLPKHQIRKLHKQKASKYPPMNPDTRKMLIEYFKPHNEKLYSLLGRRFDWDR